MSRLALILPVIGAFAWLALQDASAHAATVRHVPDDYPTVQSAINASVAGDTVLVQPGIYYENIDLAGKAISLSSAEGPGVTTLHGRNIASVITINSGEGPSTIISGFTITEGYSLFDQDCFLGGSGICIQQASPTIEGNIIRRNFGCVGVGIAVEEGSPSISHNIISDNHQSGCSSGLAGAGIYVAPTGSAQIIGNEITNNISVHGVWGGGIVIYGTPYSPGEGTTVVRDNLINGNRGGGGGGIGVVEADVDVVQNIITGNIAEYGGGVMFAYSGRQVLLNNTIVDNNAIRGEAVHVQGTGPGPYLLINNILSDSGNALYCGRHDGAFYPSDTLPQLYFNDVFSSSASSYGGACSDMTGSNGNISVAPNFFPGTYRPKGSSATTDAGDSSAPGLPSDDFDGGQRVVGPAVDMGVYESDDLDRDDVEAEDICPNEAGPPENNGCPLTQPPVGGTVELTARAEITSGSRLPLGLLALASLALTGAFVARRRLL